MMNQVQMQVGAHVDTGVIKYVASDYVIVEHEDGTSSCVHPSSIIPQDGLSMSDVQDLHAAHYEALIQTRQFISDLAQMDLTDQERGQLKAFAKRSLRLTNDDYNRLERVVKPNQEIGWFDLLGYSEAEVARQRQLMNRGVESWNLVHPEMPIAL